MSTASSPSDSPLSASLAPNSLFYDPVYKSISKTPISKTIDDAIVGIEIENEEKLGYGIAEHPAWQNHPENSLRFNGFEYVLSPPLPLNKAITATTELFDRNIKHYAKIKPDLGIPWTNSIRTSVHVHFDIGRLTWLQLYNFASLYWIMEPLLTHFCGEFRRGNLFCIRNRDSNFIRSEIRDELQGIHPMQAPLFQEDMRYASVNFNSVKKFGTLEFRIMRGVSSPDDLITWVHTLNKIRLQAIKFKTPLELKQWFMNDIDSSVLPQTVLGNVLWPTLKPYFEGVNIKDEIQTGYFDVHQILSSRPNWKLVELPIDYKKPSKFTSTAYTNDLAFLIPTTNSVSYLVSTLNLPNPLPWQLYPTLNDSLTHTLVDNPDSIHDQDVTFPENSTFTVDQLLPAGVNI